jgi:hypothetical protein
MSNRGLFVTPFDKTTLVCTGPSVLLPITTEEAVAAMMGVEPDVVTQNTKIYNQPNGQALCVSWIRFQL